MRTPDPLIIVPSRVPDPPQLPPPRKGGGEGGSLKTGLNTQFQASGPCGIDSPYPKTPGEHLANPERLRTRLEY